MDSYSSFVILPFTDIQQYKQRGDIQIFSTVLFIGILNGISVYVYALCLPSSFTWDLGLPLLHHLLKATRYICILARGPGENIRLSPLLEPPVLHLACSSTLENKNLLFKFFNLCKAAILYNIKNNYCLFLFSDHAARHFFIYLIIPDFLFI